MTDEIRHSTAVTGIDIWSPPTVKPGTGIDAVAASGIGIFATGDESPAPSPEVARSGLRVVAGGLSEHDQHKPTLPIESDPHVTDAATEPADAPPAADEEGALTLEARAEMEKALENCDLYGYLATQLANGASFAGLSDEQRKEKMVSLSCFVINMKPADAAEKLLIAQMAMLHDAAMRCFRIAAIPDQSMEGIHRNLTMAHKLTRNFALNLEALDWRRGRGQQKVTVEHVHVHAGGQAVVGSVTHTTAGEGEGSAK